jgi:hypothetical protein
MRGWSMNLLARDKRVMPWRIEDEMKRRSRACAGKDRRYPDFAEQITQSVEFAHWGEPAANVKMR